MSSTDELLQFQFDELTLLDIYFNDVSLVQYSAFLTGDSFDEAQMLQNMEACEWLTSAMRGLDAANVDPIYANMRAVCSFPYFPIVQTSGKASC